MECKALQRLVFCLLIKNGRCAQDVAPWANLPRTANRTPHRGIIPGLPEGSVSSCSKDYAADSGLLHPRCSRVIEPTTCVLRLADWSSGLGVHRPSDDSLADSCGGSSA